jgi:hypothetical protein
VLPQQGADRFYVDHRLERAEMLIQSRAIDHRLRAADQGRTARGARGQFDLPQQRHPDLAGPANGETENVEIS